MPHSTEQALRNRPLTHLGDLPVAQFLAEYWQKKPLLIRNAFPGFASPITAETLAGFALEEDVESRLIIEQPSQNPLESHWRMQHGPLREQDFALPESHWTLLVQAVDQLVPDVAELLQCFRFIPNWRLDDIMVSYAADQGTVGPHFDHYDVFLLQGEGRRHWRIGQHCDHRTVLRSDTELCLLKRFDTAWEATLEPGDMLYIPPRIAHWGTAEGPCMTYSVGFRAPSYEDLLLDFSQDLAADLLPDQRYRDAQAKPAEHPGEITPEAVARVRVILEHLLLDETRIGQWLATFGTTPKRGSALDATDRADAWAGSALVQLKARIRAAYLPGSNSTAQLYLNGEAHSCSLDLAMALSDYRPLRQGAFTAPADVALFAWLIEEQWLWEIS